MSLCQSESEVADAATALGADAGSVTPRKKGTIMNSTKVLSTDTSGRTPRVDIGWPARDERLVTVAEPLRRTEVQRARTRDSKAKHHGSANEQIAARRLPSLPGLREIPALTVP